ncbi:glycosyltransferase [Halobacteriaceae archaeon SHR40]|uniref:glycosyltransferase n=1 Tax=Halovenus amylolytica TaxID=2500550 RepID=UPI000FE41075
MVKVSVVIPVYNDPKGIQKTLESLLNLEYPTTEHEIVVVNNASTDSTQAVINRFVENNTHIRTEIESDIQSSYAARNRGICNSVGEILAFIDSDMTVEETWLEKIVEYFEKENVYYIGCNVQTYIQDDTETIIGRYSLAEEFPVEIYIKDSNFAPTCCLAIQRTVFKDIGLFTHDLVSGGDVEFGRRVANAGYPQHFAGHITMYHPARTKLCEHISKSRRHGQGAEQRYQKYRTIESMHRRPWYHPWNFFPPHPVRFFTRMSELDKKKDLILFYFLSYVFKLAEAYGQIETRINS